MKLKRCNLHYEKMSGGTVKCIEDEIPFEVPDSWEWSRLSTLGTFAGGKTPSTANCDFWGGDVLWVTSKDMKTKYIDDTLIKMSDVGFKQMQLFPPDSLLMVVRSGILRWTFPLAILKAQATVNQDIKVCSLYLHFMAEYIYNYLKASELGILTHCSKSGTTVESLNVEDIKNLLIALPPFSEQSRIDDAISLAFTQIAMIESEKLNLQSIMTQTKSKILDLAIHGKLIPQDPNDEPASVLLERIRAEKEEQIKQGKIKREKNESYIFRGDDKSYYQDKGGKRLCVEEMIPFDLPQQWLWCQLGEICDYGNCNNTDTATLPDDAWILDLEDIEKDTGKVLQRITVAERKSNSTKHAFHNGQLLYSKLRPYLNKVLVADDDGYCTSEILPLEFANIVFPPYARHVLMSAYFLGYANQCSYGVKMPRLGTNDGKRAWIPLPPLSEQHRIAAAVDAAFAQLDTIADALA